MGDRLTSWIRTTVPMIWGAVVAWLVTRGWIDAELADTMGEWAPAVATGAAAAAGAAWHAAARWL